MSIKLILLLFCKWILLILSYSQTDLGIIGCRNTVRDTEYTGTVHVTNQGYSCQRWQSQQPHEHYVNLDNIPDYNLATAANFCRNPDNKPGGPWCYTTNPDVKWQYCPVPLCTGVISCDNDPCINGGTCVQGEIYQICLPHYTGPF